MHQFEYPSQFTHASTSCSINTRHPDSRYNFAEAIQKEFEMPLASVPAIYDGEKIRLLEDPPVMVPYHVLVTFVEPALETPRPRDLERFRQSLGAWQDNRPVEATLDDIYSARHSKSEPPQL